MAQTNGNSEIVNSVVQPIKYATEKKTLHEFPKNKVVKTQRLKKTLKKTIRIFINFLIITYNKKYKLKYRLTDQLNKIARNIPIAGNFLWQFNLYRMLKFSFHGSMSTASYHVIYNFTGG